MSSNPCQMPPIPESVDFRLNKDGEPEFLICADNDLFDQEQHFRWAEICVLVKNRADKRCAYWIRRISQAASDYFERKANALVPEIDKHEHDKYQDEWSRLKKAQCLNRRNAQRWRAWAEALLK